MGSQSIPPNLTSEFFPGLSYDEALADQETLYEALKVNSSDQAATNSERNNEHQQNYSRAQPWDESYESGNVDPHLQLAIDEAVARSLQKLEDAIDIINEEIIPHNAYQNPPESSSTMGPNEDDPLPEMTYEEMQSLGETIGTESKGLSENDINLLPSFKYKSGFFFNKRKPGQCTICISEYKNKQYLTTLPCAHQYHQECITRWLKDNKNCPICQKEVNLSP